MHAAGRDGNPFRFGGPLAQDRFVNVIAVLLFLEHRYVFLRDHVERDIFNRDPIELRIDCDQIDRARLVHVDVTEITPSLVTNYVRQSRDQGIDIAGYATAAFAFETFGDEAH